MFCPRVIRFVQAHLSWRKQLVLSPCLSLRHSLSVSSAAVTSIDPSSSFDKVVTTNQQVTLKEYHVLPNLNPTLVTSNMLQKNDLSKKMQRLHNLLSEAESCIKDCKQSDMLTAEEELKEARDSVKELYFEFMEILDDFSLKMATEFNKTNVVQQVRRRLNSVEHVIDVCNVWQLQVIMSQFSDSYAKLHRTLSKQI